MSGESDEFSKTQVLKAFVKNGGHKVSLSTILTVIGMLGALGATWGSFSADNAKLQEKVRTMEERQKEDREETKKRLERIEDKVQNTDKNVTEIRAILQQMSRGQR